MNRERTRALRRRRGGFTLIEMVMIIAGVTTLLGLCAGLLHLMFRLEGAGRSALADADHVARLARQFRADVRGADAARVVDADGAPGGLDLVAEGAPAVSYRPTPGALLRTERAGEKVVRREAYTFGKLGPARFGIDGAGTVRLDLPRSVGPTAPGGRPGFVVEARTGRHRPKGGTK